MYTIPRVRQCSFIHHSKVKLTPFYTPFQGLRVQRYDFYLKVGLFTGDIFRNSQVYSHSRSIHILSPLLLVVAYLKDDGDGGRRPILFSNC